ncbi:MAG: hypothetical protein ACK5LC_17275 [Coprobacillaceae bacterium]
MKIKLYFIIMVEVLSNYNIYEKEDNNELIIDIEKTNNESYEGIQSNYKNFNFFSNKTIEKIEVLKNKEREDCITKQNFILITK